MYRYIRYTVYDIRSTTFSYIVYTTIVCNTGKLRFHVSVCVVCMAAITIDEVMMTDESHHGYSERVTLASDSTLSRYILLHRALQQTE